MKKQNSRFRSGNNNSGYTLNYKFDSVSIAGKINGTALDLIRRYNDLAKEAQGSGDYVDMEIYRQYAEHYRKIVTEINERRQNRQDNQYKSEENNDAESYSADESETANEEAEKTEAIEPVTAPNGYVETLPATDTSKSFQVVEIKEDTTEKETQTKPKRVYRRRTATPKKAPETEN